MSRSKENTEIPTSSFVSHPEAPGVRKFSLNLDPDTIEKLQRRRSSLEKLDVEKLSPWMQLYDFTDPDDKKDENKKRTVQKSNSLNLDPEVIERLQKRRASLDKLQVEKLSPWMELYDFTDDANANTKNENPPEH